MNKFQSVEEVETFFAEVDWEDAIIREVVVQSPSYVSSDGYVVAPDGLPSLRLIVISPDDACASIELVAHDVEEVGISYGAELSPAVEYVDGVFEVRLRGRMDSPIRARELSGRRLDSSETVGQKSGLLANAMFNASGIKSLLPQT